MESCLDVNSDMISNLPANVTDQILVRLPIIDAVRTSVLSTNWRYKWTTIPELVFHDNQLVLPSPPQILGSPHGNTSKAKLINIIDRVLLLHTGFIQKFEFSTTGLWMGSTIDCWILFLSRKNIKELVLKFALAGPEQMLPTCFFSAQQICTLELRQCVLKPPPTFTGFSNLKSLYLHKTIFVDKDGFECLISKCPVLERLTWEMSFYNLGHLNICSPNLKYLCLKGNITGICFENTPLLSDVSIGLTENLSDEKFLQSETGNVVKVFSSLPNLRKFVMGYFFLKFLTVGKIPEKLPFTCHHLSYLSLHLDFHDVNEICITLCLLNSSLNLRGLNIRESSSFSKSGHDTENFWEERTLIDWNMSGLQFVKTTNINGFELELEFIKLLLANSPKLEMLIIVSNNLDIESYYGVKFLKELLIFPRASPNAKIKFLEEHEDVKELTTLLI